MLGPRFKGKWITLFMILNISRSPIWKISLLTRSIKLITRCILGPFSYGIDTIKFDWINTNVCFTLAPVNFLVLLFQDMEFVSILWKYRKSSTCLQLLHLFSYNDFKGELTSCDILSELCWVDQRIHSLA